MNILNNRYFSGYSSYCAALKEYAKLKRLSNVGEILFMHLGFGIKIHDFDLTTVENSLTNEDTYLDQDLNQFGSIDIVEEAIPTQLDTKEMTDFIKQRDIHILKVEANGNHLKFSEQEGLTYFILRCPEDEYIIVEPYTNQEQKVQINHPDGIEFLNEIRNGTLIHFDESSNEPMLLDNGYESGEREVNSTCHELRQLFTHQIERFLNEKMYDQIDQLGVAIDKYRLIYGKKHDRIWSPQLLKELLPLYIQIKNMRQSVILHNMEVPPEFLELEYDWAFILKRVYEYSIYLSHNIEEIIYELLKIGKKEKKIFRNILDK